MQPEFQPVSHNIEHQGPLKITIAIPAHDDQTRTYRSELVNNRFRSNIAKMPDFVGIAGHFSHALREAIVRIGENKNACGFFEFGIFRHLIIPHLQNYRSPSRTHLRFRWTSFVARWRIDKIAGRQNWLHRERIVIRSPRRIGSAICGRQFIYRSYAVIG